MNKKNFLKFTTLILFCLLTSASLFAYQLSPLNVSFKPSGADSTKAYTIINDSDAPIAIEVSAHKRMIDKDGNEYTEKAPQYFSIQPNKMIIKPQSTQIVRVQYRGPRTVTKEMSFRIIAEQIAYSQGATAAKGEQMINFLFVYSTSAYVAPSKVVERVNSEVYKNEEGKLVVKLTNAGSVHQLLNSLSITVNGNNGSSYTLTEEDLKNFTGKNLLTDSTVEIPIVMPEILKGASSYKAEVNYEFTYTE